MSGRSKTLGIAVESSKPKLLVVTTTFPRWKDDTDPPFVYELSRRLTDEFEVTIHTPHYSGALNRENMAGMRIHRFRYFFEKWEKIAGHSAILPFLKEHKSYYFILPFFLLFQALSMLLLVKKLKPDVIHAHWLIPCGFFAVCTKLIGRSVPVVVTCHGADVFGLRSYVPTLVKKWTLSRSGFVTVVSRALKERVAELGQREDMIQVIPMGVDSKMFNPDKFSAELTETLQIKGKFLLFVGRLSEKKGVRFLLDAAGLLLERGYDFTLVLVGDGEQSSVLRKQAELRGLQKRVRFVGALPNSKTPSYYASADLFVGPSIESQDGDTEGFGLTFIEASFSGCFIIGTRCGGIVDVIEDKRTGLLAKNADSLDLADKIEWFFSNPDKIVGIAEAAREEHKKKYDWENVSQRYESLLADICKDQNKRSISS